MKKIMYSLLILSFINTICTDNQILQGVSFFSPRSQSTNAARNIVGSYPYNHRYDIKSCYATISAAPEYTHSFHDGNIANALFGTDELHISGSQIENRGSNDILADYFGLSTQFESTVGLSPKIMNLMCSFNAFIGLDGLIPGLYVEIHAPAVWTRWNFEMCESVITGTSITPFPPLYMAAEEVAPPINAFSDAFTGNVTFGQMNDPYRYGKICGPQSKGGLSDFLCILGYDIKSSEKGRFGLNIRAAAPTGSRPNSEYFFEPIVGNGKHWELGIGFDSRVLLWEADGVQELSIFAQVNLMHFFNATQQRSFDFCGCSFNFCENGFGSRFILLKEFDSEGNYIGQLLPAINVTTLCCDVHIDLEFEILVMFGYTYHGFEFDIGYNGWIRDKEKISLNECIPARKYGLKGIQDVFTIIESLSNLTQSTATLHGNNLSEQALVMDQNSPVFISTSDLNLESAASPTVLTHKVFTYVGHGWQEKENNRMVPFIGAGISAEFEGNNKSDTEKPNRNTLSQWAFFLKGGFAF